MRKPFLFVGPICYAMGDHGLAQRLFAAGAADRDVAPGAADAAAPRDRRAIKGCNYNSRALILRSLSFALVPVPAPVLAGSGCQLSSSTSTRYAGQYTAPSSSYTNANTLPPRQAIRMIPFASRAGSPARSLHPRPVACRCSRSPSMHCRLTLSKYVLTPIRQLLPAWCIKAKSRILLLHRAS